MTYTDKRVNDSNGLSYVVAIFFMCFWLYMEYICLNALLLTVTWQSKLFAIIGSLLIFAYLINHLGYIINGPKIINSINVNQNNIEIIDSMKGKSILKCNELKKLDNNEFNWFLGITPVLFKNDKPFFSISFSNGKHFAISPHMEKLDELEIKLINILNSNKKTLLL